MASSKAESTSWVVFRLQNSLFSINSDFVREMIASPAIVNRAKADSYMRGLAKIRQEIIPILDLREFMGMPSLQHESVQLLELLKKREEDHRNWLKELEASVREKREFKLTTNPRECAFGKWYYSFETENFILKSLLKRFEEPHTQIHQLGVTVRKMCEEDRCEKALRLIDEAKANVLASLIQLFNAVYVHLQGDSREVCLILQSDKMTIGVTVDSVLAVESITETTVENLKDIFSELQVINSDAIDRVGRRRHNQETVMLINPEKLVAELNMDGLEVPAAI